MKASPLRHRGRLKEITESDKINTNNKLPQRSSSMHDNPIHSQKDTFYRPIRLESFLTRGEYPSNRSIQYIPRDESIIHKATEYLACPRKRFVADREEAYLEGMLKYHRERERVENYESQIPYYNSKYKPYVDDKRERSTDGIINRIIEKRNVFEERYKELFSRRDYRNPILRSVRNQFASLEVPKKGHSLTFLRDGEKIINRLSKKERGLQELLTQCDNPN